MKAGLFASVLGVVLISASSQATAKAASGGADLILTDAMGSVTEMHFTLVRIDTEVSDAEFEFVPPPGVQVIKAG